MTGSGAASLCETEPLRRLVPSGNRC
jgi:hypothetical protein